jgi:glutathione S-transferase
MEAVHSLDRQCPHDVVNPMPTEAPTLYAHPFASYCWKVLIALYENDTPFNYRVVDNPTVLGELDSLWPIKKFPVLKDGDTVVIESTIIVEYLMLLHAGARRLIPDGIDAAMRVRFLDRFFDNYIQTPVQKLVLDHMRAEGEHDPRGVADARASLDIAYEWLNKQIGCAGWAVGDEFTLADCAAAPALFYADWVHPISEQFSEVRAYRSRLLARPSVMRTVEEARPYRTLFPLGAPDRD